MKIILTGTSGFIGTEILSQYLHFTFITSFIILSRRPLPDIAARDARIKVIVLENFLVYPENVVSELTEARACLWALGGSATSPTPKGKNDEVEVQYPLALARVMISKTSSRPEHEESRKRFLFISGVFSERSQNKHLWFLEEGRKARGLAETKLLELAKEDEFEVVIIKAAYVLKKDSLVPETIVGLSQNDIRVNELAAVMIDISISGNGSGIVENSQLRKRGKMALKSQVGNSKIENYRRRHK